MKKFSTWMILLLAIIFWLLRIIATYTNKMGIGFMVQPLDQNTEIFLIFIALLAFILIVKRKLLGVVIYIVAYCGYFGVYLFDNLANISAGTLGANQYMNIFFSFLGVILPILVLIDWLFDKNKKDHPTDKKTDWFYKNEQYDRNDDDRVDKNNYRTL